MAGFTTHKERLMQQCIDSELVREDLEDVASELVLMELEGIDLTDVTVRDVLARLGIY